MGRPVISLGEVFYNSCDLVCHLDNIKNLPEAIHEMLNNYRFDEEKLLKYITAVFQGTYPGVIDDPFYNPDVLTPENLARLADAVCRHWGVSNG
jgi:hypothetical protein